MNRIRKEKNKRPNKGEPKAVKNKNKNNTMSGG